MSLQGEEEWNSFRRVQVNNRTLHERSAQEENPPANSEYAAIESRICSVNIRRQVWSISLPTWARVLQSAFCLLDAVAMLFFWSFL